jgi:hypothetical protein
MRMSSVVEPSLANFVVLERLDARLGDAVQGPRSQT